MNISRNIFFPLFIIALTALSSCLKTEVYPVTPVIAYKDFIMYGSDSADFIFTFKDGDGDIGLRQADTGGTFHSSGSYYYNFFMKYYYQTPEGSFSVYVNPKTKDTLNYKYRIPYITPIGQNKILDGEVKVKLYAPFYVIEQNPPHKIIRFEVFIYDRALNKSNVVATPEITVP